MKHNENPFNPAIYLAITLDKKLSLVKHELEEKGVNDLSVLSIQAYLLCLCKQGYLKDGQGYERKEELYERYLSKAADLRDDLKVSFSAESVKDFLRDPEGVLAQGAPSLFADTFQKILNNHVRYGHGERDFLRPAELTELTVSLSGYKPGMTIYNPYAGVASYASKLMAGSRYFAEEKDPKVWALGVMRMLMDDCYSENFIHGDSLRSQWSGPFDIVISSPPFGYGKEKKTYAAELIKNAETLLSEKGRMVVVAQPVLLIHPDFRKLLTTPLLSTVITLPQKLISSTSISCVVLVLEKRKESEEITLVEGRSFFRPEGRFMNTLDIKGLQEAMKRSDPTCVVKVSIEDIERNDFRLLPDFYLNTPETSIPTVRLCELGTFLNLPRTKEKVQKGIRIKDLCIGSDVREVKPKRLSGSTVRFRRLEQSALLISANRRCMKMGLVSADPDHPVFIAEHIYAFVPDSKKADVRFIAREILKSDGGGSGSSVFYIRQEELAAYPIPFLPLEEQRKAGSTDQLHFTECTSFHNGIVLNDAVFCISENVSIEDVSIKPQRASATKSERPKRLADTISKSTVAWVGPKLEDFPSDALLIKKEFDSINNDMREWLKRKTDSLDAVIIYHAGTVRATQIPRICDIYSPVYIISNDLDTLENDLRREYMEEEYIKKYCFQCGYEKELLECLESEIKEDKTPAGQIRRRFAEQWKVIKTIDATLFPGEDSSLESLLMEILLDAEDPKKHINGNTLRTIRDKYFLEKMEYYGLLPPINKMFDRGAQMNFIADHYYTNGERCYYLHQEWIPSPLNIMVKATVDVLNHQSHEIGMRDKNLQWALVHVLLGIFSQMGELIEKGLFEEESKDKNRQYWTEFDPKEFVSGKRRVRVRKDKYGKDYFYADNVHLKSEQCKKIDVKEGDFVFISDVKPEKRPIDEIVFYATSFSKA